MSGDLSMLKKVNFLLLAIGAMIFLPYVGSWLHYNGKFPDHFFDYPPLSAEPKAPFNMFVFVMLSILALAVAVLYVFPRIFGFKKPIATPAPDIKKVSLPIWFWIGLIMWGGCLTMLFTRMTELKWLLHWSDLPIFWGFTLMLDGIVYKRKGGVSIIATIPQEMVGIALSSVAGWMIFEYLNFFVGENWYYPAGDIIPNTEFLLYAIIGSSGLIPMAFEWYSLLNTFEGMKHRFDQGLKFSLPLWFKNIVLVIAFSGMFVSGLFPNQMFFSLWVSPLLILAIILDRINVWTPFEPIKDGNWTPILVFALTYLLTGVSMEAWNFFSAAHANDVVTTYAPAYWVYSLPYVNTPRMFEMPILGYLGYLPFSVYCWIWWIMFAFLCNIPTRFADLTARGN
ncbi:MAG: hypothetical protein HQ556_05695 [Candidatus Marinimicrobia bacterium]|nr:hypothetical protein [Candidatus Neomarinimicrobiota bacterium]